MPYYLHAREYPPDRGEEFATMPEAVSALKDGKQSTHKITFVASDSEHCAWTDRERERFYTGEYIPVPWSSGVNELINFSGDKQTHEHYAHLSIQCPGLIAYTKSPEHGVQDRQTCVKPGRYLAEFFPNESADKVAHLIAACAAEAITLQFTTDPDVIERIYIGGPRSCMAGKLPGHEYIKTSIHPTRVYGNSPDLALAYYGDIDHAAARTIVWPDKHRYVRAYGNDPVLIRLLKLAGYAQGSLIGARVRAIPDPDHGGYLMPYFDGIGEADRRGEYFVLGEGSIDVQTTTGYTDGEPNDDDDDSRHCDNCHDRYDPNDDGGDGYCQSCYDNRWTCDNCNDVSFNDDGMYSTDYGTYCESCYDDRATPCAMPDCGNTWHDENEFTSSQMRMRRNNGVADLCADCADHVIPCESCGERYDPRNGNCCDVPEDTDTDTDSPIAVETETDVQS